MIEDWSQRPLFAYGFSIRKRRLLAQFLNPMRVKFISRGTEVDDGGVLMVWGAMLAPESLPTSTLLIRVEDGFLRSVGLGVALSRPMSWVFDASGIYFDPNSESELETTLQTAKPDQRCLERAEAIRSLMVDAGLSKYNLKGRPWRPKCSTKPVVLVVGQVENDASVRLGCIDVKTNLQLIQLVRQMRPDAWLVYKPHPDVEAGLRGQGADESAAADHCDEVLFQVGIDMVWPCVDEVHVMTSLAGFEALLRDIPVYCHGLPFYAGYGLTVDRHRHPRRTRRLTLLELVHGAILSYPTYLSRETKSRCSAETAIDELLSWRGTACTQTPFGWARRLIRPFLYRP